jgi:glycosyltransferase involved in cell wall biosynthesis
VQLTELNTTDPSDRPRATLSVAIITLNEEANIRRTLESVKWADEIVIVDSGSTDRTCEIAKEYGAKVFVEPWKGFAAQKNSALDKCTGDWILSLDADEEVSVGLREFWHSMILQVDREIYENFRGALRIGRQNFFLGRWVKQGGYYPDPKYRLFKRGCARFEQRAVHEDVEVIEGVKRNPSWHAESGIPIDIIHHAYPTLTSYIEHMNRYSSLGAEMVVEKRGKVGFSLINILLRPWATFVYNYFFRLGFLDGKEGLLLHLYHAVYVSWKYAKAWEMSRKNLQS